MKKLRISVLMHEDLVPPEDASGLSDQELASAQFKTEYDVVVTLQDLGHEVRPLGVSDDLTPIRDAISEFKPHIAFNLLEEFHGIGVYDQHIVSYLELMKQPYSGCNPRGLTLAHDKALSKKILAYHDICVPRFAVFPIGKNIQPDNRIEFPLLVKSSTEEGSVGISQASIVHDDGKLQDRVEFVHEQLGTDAIAEQYIEGRELYVGVIGNERLSTLPIWEMEFKNMPATIPHIATGKVKWDEKYQKRHGIQTGTAKNIPKDVAAQIPRLCKQIYQALSLSGYARMDLRLTNGGQIYLLEANPNPQLAYGEDFAESAHCAGIDYEQLLMKIVKLGLKYRAQGIA